MGITIVALAVGAVLGLLAGGRPANVGNRPVRALVVVVAAAALQVLPDLLDLSDDAALACVLASYALLVAFALANIRLVGMAVVLVGIVLNVVVIAVNSGMPVRPEAILTVDRDRDASELATLDFGAKRHLEDDTDRLTFLGDVVPVRALGQVLSFGDLIMAVGIADVVFRLLRPAGARDRRRHRRMDDVRTTALDVGGPHLAGLG